MTRLALLLATCVPLVAACGDQITITDSIDLTWDFDLTLDRFKNDLHEPYVRGADMAIYVTSDNDKEMYRDWQVVSDTPDVFQVSDLKTDTHSLVASGIAAAAGDATLTILDTHGDPVGEARVRVRVPDAIELDAHGYLILGRDDEAAMDELRIAEQGTATYLVKYLSNGQELHGNGVLSVEPTPGTPPPATGAPIVAVPRTSYFFEDREWITLATAAAGDQSLRFFADGATVEDRVVHTVPRTEISDVVILAESEKKRKDGDWLVLLAQAYDAAGRRIFGIDYQWNVGGTDATGMGDLYRYSFAKAVDTMVIANTQGFSDSVMIHSDSGYVSSSNGVGCAVDGGSPRGWIVPSMGLLGLALVRRARRLRLVERRRR